MPLKPLRWFIGSLRFRLTLWNTATLLIVAVISLLVLREAVRLTLWREADAQLLEDSNEIQQTIEALYPETDEIFAQLNRMASTHTHRGLFVRIYDENLNNHWASINLPTILYPVELLKSGRKPVSAGQHRMVHFQLNHPGVPRWSVRVGTSFEPLDAYVAQLTRLMATVALLVMIVAPIGGYWLAGRVTRPLKEIINTTEHMRPGQLDQRLTIRGTHDELDRLSTTINGFLDRIAAYIRQNREFTANAAHELRSPLTAIQSSLEVALASDRTTAEYQELLAEVLDECENLRVLVNHLLLLSESDAGRLQIDKKLINLDQVVRQACDMFQAVGESSDVTLRITRLDSAECAGHAGSLRQVINNLIDNAIKFTPAGGRVSVSVTALPDEIELRVEDTGIGIPAGDLPFILQRFYRGDKGRERVHRGSGLGLSISDSIISAHHGRIRIESQPGVGTTVIVNLPRRLSAAGAGPPVDAAGC